MWTIDGKVGTRWYLWVTRSPSVVFYCIDPSRSAAVPGAHFAGLQADKVIIVCDRYSAYKKLARLAPHILLAFCWAHVRRDFLDAGRAFRRAGSMGAGVEGAHRHALPPQRTASGAVGSRAPPWRTVRGFQHHHRPCRQKLQSHARGGNPWGCRRGAGVRCVHPDDRSAGLSKSARRQQEGLSKPARALAGAHAVYRAPEVPMDNNRAENTLRTPVTGRKNYYGSGSIWSAQLAATLFAILQTLGLWGINPRHWLSAYLSACAENGGSPQALDPFLPWAMDETRLAELSAPLPSATSPPPEPSSRPPSRPRPIRTPHESFATAGATSTPMTSH